MVILKNRNYVTIPALQIKSPLVILTKQNLELILPTHKFLVADVLIKIPDKDYFQKSIEKAIQCYENQNKEDVVFIRTNNRFVRLAYSEILYIKAMENFVQIVTHKETYTKLISLKKILEQLPSELFMQVHRSFVVNIAVVKTIDKDCITMQDTSIPIGSSFKEKLLKLVGKRLIQRRK